MVEFYSNLTSSQVRSVHNLINLLRRTRVIGSLHAETVYSDDGSDLDFDDKEISWYTIKKLGYDPSKRLIDAEEMLEDIFGKRLYSIGRFP